MIISDFAPRLSVWQRQHGRHDLPWQNTRDPYNIWISEIMLQQTQVGTVIPYFQRFIERFPDIVSLASAEQDDVLQLWSGLGYYSRARNLQRAAHQIMSNHGGNFPQDFDAIQALPGIGRSTAAAISAFAFGQRRAILDGNVKRVFARYFGIEGFPGDKQVEKRMWQQAEAVLPQQDIEIYTQALMDLGATLCSRARPHCKHCPLIVDCVAHTQQRVAELPTPRPKKTLPEREITMLLIQSQGEILLEKRPLSGIWGGLWSLPEIGMAADPIRFCHEKYGLSATLAPALPKLTHTFTHFKLHIQPQSILVKALLPHANQPGQIWLSLEDALDAAIPTAVRKLLQQLIHHR